jgi:hypothetical protein
MIHGVGMRERTQALENQDAALGRSVAEGLDDLARDIVCRLAQHVDTREGLKWQAILRNNGPLLHGERDAFGELLVILGVAAEDSCHLRLCERKECLRLAVRVDDGVGRAVVCRGEEFHREYGRLRLLDVRRGTTEEAVLGIRSLCKELVAALASDDTELVAQRRLELRGAVGALDREGPLG